MDELKLVNHKKVSMRQLTKIHFIFMVVFVNFLMVSTAFAVGYPRIMQNSSFDLRKDLTTVTFPASSPPLNVASSWALWGDSNCLAGDPHWCIASWKTTGNTGCGGSPATGKCIEVAQASTYNSATNVPNQGSQIVAELNASQQSRLYQETCMLAGETVTMHYSFSPRANFAANQQVTAGLWTINDAGPVGGALSSVDSSVRAYNDSFGFKPETAIFISPVTGAYQLGLEAKLPNTGSTGNLIDDVSIDLIPLIDLDSQPLFTTAEGGTGSTALNIRMNGTVATGGITVALRLTGTASESDFSLGTPVGLAGTTPTLTHTAGSLLWLLFIPAGQYDAGLGIVGNTRYGITIPVTAIYDYPLRENAESLIFTLEAPGVDGASPSTRWRQTNPICDGTSVNQVTYTITETKPLLKVNKRVASLGSPTDTFTTQIKNSSGTLVSSTSASPGGGVTTTNAVGTYSALASFQGNYDQSYTLTEVMASGGALSGYATSIHCTNSRTVGSATPLPSGFGQSFSIIPRDLDDITCLLINGNAPLPTLTITKVSVGGAGTFSFSGNNGLTSPQSITTTSSGTPKAGVTKTLSAPYVDTTITETGSVTGFALVSATCTDTNSTTTGNTGNFGSLSGNTLTIPAANVVAGSALSCVFTNATPKISIQKISQGGTATFSFTSATNTSTPSAINTSTINTATPAAPSANSITTIGVPVTISEGFVSGYLLTAVNCTDENSTITGNPASFGSFSGSTLTVPAANVLAGASINCIFTNTRPTVKIQKITHNGFGETFSFTQSNLSSAPPDITTAAEDAAYPVAPVPIAVSTVGSNVSITETQQAAYYGLTSVTCTDTNRSITGNPASFGTISGNTLTIPATNVRAGADITCVFTNTKRATVRVAKTTEGGFGGSFNFSKTNLDTTIQNLTTTAANTPVTATAINVTNLNTNVTVTETPIAGYALTSVSCTDVNNLNSGNPSTSFGTFSGNVLTIPAANIVAGADITCLFTNTRPTVTVQVVSVGGYSGSFSFTQTNLASTPSAITTITVNEATPKTPVATNVTTVGTDVTLTQTPAPNYTLTSVSCTDANSAITGKTGIFGSLSGNKVTIPATNIVAGATINCIFTDTKASAVTIRGTVFKDTGTSSGIANNSLQDGAEIGIAGVTVKLTNCSGTIYSTTSTDGTGGYSLPTAGLSAGTVCVEESNLSGYLSTGVNVAGSTAPSGYTLVNTDKISFLLATNTNYNSLNFSDVPVSQLLTDGIMTGLSGTTVMYTHTFIAGSGGTVNFSLPGATATPALTGWKEVLYTDTNCNGILDNGENLTPTTAISVPANTKICLILKEFIPAGASLGAKNLVIVKADFVYTGASPTLTASYTRQDLTTVSYTAVDLKKMVRNVTTDGTGTPNWKIGNTAKAGEILEYRITYTNNGGTPINALKINDVTPAYTTFISALAGTLPATLTACTKKTPTAPTSTSCLALDTTGGTGSIEWKFDGSLAPSNSGFVTFRVQLD
jgi:hypothetical protein